MDAGYLTLIDLLQRQGSDLGPSVSRPQILGAIAHYLSVIPPEHVSSFAQTISLSPTLWDPLDIQHVAGCHSAFRQSVSLKIKSLKWEHRAGLASSRWSFRITINQWLQSMSQGVSSTSTRPKSIVRLTILGGLLAGLEDVSPQNRSHVEKAKERIREAGVKCASEVISMLNSSSAERWEEEFLPDLHSAAIYILHATLLLIPPSQLAPLPLFALSRLLSEEICETFKQGFSFLGNLAEHTSLNSEGKFAIDPSSRTHEDVKLFVSSQRFTSIGPICQLLGRTFDLLIESTPNRDDVFAHLGDNLDTLDAISGKVQGLWAKNPLSSLEDEERIALSTRPTLVLLWTAFKTLIFASVSISQSVLSMITFYPSAPIQELALGILTNLGHLSFISSKFGTQASGGGFKQQQRAFFGALDVLSSSNGQGAGSNACDTFLHTLAANLKGSSLEAQHPVQQSQTAFFLACAEQLISCISDDCLEGTVLPIAHQNLDNLAYREIFESAHSVMLSVFASHRKQSQGTNAKSRRGRIAERLAPFYLRSLLENSQEGRLSTQQLCLAYASLVGGATAAGNDALAWLCIDALLDAMRDANRPRIAPSSQVHRLRLALVSLIPGVSVAILPRLLDRVEQSINEAKAEEKEEVWHTVNGMMDKVGDKGKEISLKWWLDMSERLRGNGVDVGGPFIS